MAAKPKTRALTKTTPPIGDLAQEIASTLDGRDITRPFVAELEQPRDPRLLSSIDWGVYERLRKDDQVKSCMEQRIRAVVSAEWDVLPGDNEDPRSVEAAEKLKANLERIGWDRITKKMLWATFHGFSVAEAMYPKTAIDGLWQFEGFKVRNARRFRYDRDRNLRLLTMKKPLGEIVPERKFWVLTEGGIDDDEVYGEGLADWLYWPVFFKRNGMRFWNIFLDKFGSPTAKITYKRGATAKDIATAINMLRSLSQDSGIAVPEGIAVEFLQVMRSGTADYETLCRYMDSAISKIILSQTMTTDDGSSNSQAQVHAGVKLEVVKADADLCSDSFNEGPSRWWTDWNYGTDVAAPQVVRLVDEEADLKVMAETDSSLNALGWVRTDESFRDTYGDGYERKAEPEVKIDATDDKKLLGDNVVALNKPRQISLAEGDVYHNEPDPVDLLVADLLATEGWKPLSSTLSAVAQAIAVSDNPEQLDRALLDALDTADRERLTQALARSQFALRIGAEAGVDAT